MIRLKLYDALTNHVEDVDFASGMKGVNEARSYAAEFIGTMLDEGRGGSVVFRTLTDDGTETDLSEAEQGQAGW